MKLIIVLLLGLSSAFASQLDTDLRIALKQEGIQPILEKRELGTPMFKLGGQLFMDNILSGNNNISCMTCHHPMLGTSDALPLSIGEGGTGMGENRKLGEGEIIPRHSPHLINLGLKESTIMFWDGRVSFDPQTKTFETPEPGLNGAKPELEEYVQVLSSALSAQAMFPPLSHEEMRGQKGSNPIADAADNKSAWELLTTRVVSQQKYQKLIKDAFGVKNMKKVNFAHLAEAIGHFQKNMFLVNQTAFDKYLAGDNNAMTEAQKRGALVFYGSARCVQCHSGVNFTDNKFHNTAFPQIGPGKNADGNDLGRYNVTGDDEDLYTFKTPSLRNVKHSAPYGHTGSLKTLEQVVNHYTHPMRSNHHYNPGFRNLPYSLNLDTKFMNERLRRVDPIIGRMGIFISPEDQKDLVEFLGAISL